MLKKEMITAGILGWMVCSSSSYTATIRHEKKIPRQQHLKTVKQVRINKEETARQAFYAELQADMLRQQLLKQQQEYFAQQQEEQQRRYQAELQILEQQRLERESQERQQAWINLGNTIQQSANSLANTFRDNAVMMNNMSNQMMINNQQMMQNWAPNRGGSVNCYNLGSITRCNY